jgi:hypothetical protein
MTVGSTKWNTLGIYSPKMMVASWRDTLVERPKKDPVPEKTLSVVVQNNTGRKAEISISEDGSGKITVVIN